MAVIEIQDIARHFMVGSETIKALKSIDLSIQKNEFVALMGQSGSGKSTLMNILGCLDTPNNGTYTLANKNVSQLKDNSLAEIRNQEIGFIFQSFNLLPKSTALENVMLPLVYAGVHRQDREKKSTKSIGKSWLIRSYSSPTQRTIGRSKTTSSRGSSTRQQPLYYFGR